MRTRAIVVGLLLVIGLELAPHLTPNALLPVSLVWAGLLVWLIGATARVVAGRWGRGTALVLVLIGIGLPAVLTAIDWEGSLGTWLPCRRNYFWLPSYLLRSSPTESAVFSVDGVRVKVCYGSPRARARRMIGGPAVPFGRLWRTGANEPTTIRLSAPLTIAGVVVPAGKVSLYTVPGPETWEIIVNRQTGQWGIESEYSDQVRAGELGRGLVPSRRNEGYQEALVIAPRARGTDGIDLVLRWETTEVPIPILRRTTGERGRVARGVGKIQDRIGLGLGIWVDFLTTSYRALL